MESSQEEKDRPFGRSRERRDRSALQSGSSPTVAASPGSPRWTFMAVRFIVLAAVACVMFSAAPNASRAQSDQQELKLVTPQLSIFREQIRPTADALPVPTGFSREQILHGDRVFHGEAANGQCSVCHGKDGKGTPNGNDLTAGMFVWSDGSVKELKRTILHNMAVAPGMDGDLKPADVDAVSAYVWAISRQPPPQ